MKKEIIISAILFKYIDEYLTEISNYSNLNIYYGVDWSVEVIKMEDRKMGKLSFPLNHVIFRANEDTCDQLVYKFRMKFMSAGA